MIPLQSKLENLEIPYSEVKSSMDQCGFVLGSNWDYDHGYFDRPLDGVNKVWLRIPFQVTTGSLEGEAVEANDSTRIIFGTPFILRHIYEEGIDQEGESGAFRSLVDQFQDPVDPDAPVEGRWVDIAWEQLQTLEHAVIH